MSHDHIWEKQGLGKAPFRVVGFCRNASEGWESNYLDVPGDINNYHIGTCNACGAGLVNNYLIDSADGKHFSVGCDCVRKTGDGGLLVEVKGVKRTILQMEKAEERRQRQAQWNAERDIKLKAFYDNAPAACITLLAYNGGNPFVKDIAAKLERYGDISDRQLDAAFTAIQRDIERAEKTKDAQPVPKTNDRIKISGIIIKTEWKDSDFGGRTVGTIEDDRGFKVWGTIPQGHPDDRIEFMARVTVSDNDDKFGFFSRPTKIKIIED